MPCHCHQKKHIGGLRDGKYGRVSAVYNWFLWLRVFVRRNGTDQVLHREKLAEWRGDVSAGLLLMALASVGMNHVVMSAD